MSSNAGSGVLGDIGSKGGMGRGGLAVIAGGLLMGRLSRWACKGLLTLGASSTVEMFFLSRKSFDFKLIALKDGLYRMAPQKIRSR